MAGRARASGLVAGDGDVVGGGVVVADAELQALRASQAAVKHLVDGLRALMFTGEGDGGRGLQVPDDVFIQAGKEGGDVFVGQGLVEAVDEADILLVELVGI